MKINWKISALFLAAGIILTSCGRFLEEKPDKALAVPTKLVDLQALLDNYAINNNSGYSSGEVCADNYYLADNTYAGISSFYEGAKRKYIWEKDHLFDETTINDWFFAYRTIAIANHVLENVDGIDRSSNNEKEWDNVKGQALLYRGMNFLHLLYLFSQAYDESTADTDLGIPARLHFDFNVPSFRSSVKESYLQVISDLKSAARLLPVTPVHKLRGSRPAAYGLLARSYLSMRKYSEAGGYADSCLALYNTLIDYNQLDSNAAFPFERFNEEVILDMRGNHEYVLLNSNAKIVDSLYELYDADDLRKALFFKTNSDGSRAFKGGYSGSTSLFCGVSADEIYLIRAESQARLGNLNGALAVLNTFLRSRYKTGEFEDYTVNTSSQILDTILKERKKQLVYRNLRWSDIKRLNKDGANIRLTRTVNGKTYVLEPNDLRYALAIPEEVIEKTGMPQNPAN